MLSPMTRYKYGNFFVFVLIALKIFNWSMFSRSYMINATRFKTIRCDLIEWLSCTSGKCKTALKPESINQSNTSVTYKLCINPHVLRDVCLSHTDTGEAPPPEYVSLNPSGLNQFEYRFSEKQGNKTPSLKHLLRAGLLLY